MTARGTPRRHLGATADDAHAAVLRAVKAGILQPRPASCEVCGIAGRVVSDGRWNIERHHHSNLPEHHLDLADVCRKCHRAIHAGRIAEPRTGELRSGERLQHHGKEWSPRQVIDFLVYRKRFPKTTTHMDRWLWAVSFLAFAPPPEPSSKPGEWERWRAWDAAIPRTWLAVGL